MEVTDLNPRERELEELVSKMTARAGVGACQFTVEGKHACLKEILALGARAGYDILGQKKTTDDS